MPKGPVSPDTQAQGHLREAPQVCKGSHSVVRPEPGASLTPLLGQGEQGTQEEEREVTSSLKEAEKLTKGVKGVKGAPHLAHEPLIPSLAQPTSP